MMNYKGQNGIRNVLQGHKTIPVVTFVEGDDPVQFMHYLLSINVSCIEVTLRTPQGIKAIESLRLTFGKEITIGAGTVIDVSQVEILQKMDVDFFVSPGSTQALINSMHLSGIAYLPGAVTPTEVMGMRALGLETLKFFPANLFGGLDALKNLGQLFPDVKFCPTGGVTTVNASSYLSLQNVIAVGGSWFQKDYSTGQPSV